MRALAVFLIAGACYAQSIPFHQLRITPSSTATAAGQIDFAAKNNAHAVSLAAPDTLTGNTLWRLPAADGTANQAICTDGGGNLFFCSPSGSGTPGGPGTAVQFNSAGVFGGSANMEWDGGLQKLTVQGIATTAAIDSKGGFVQSEGGFLSNANIWNGIESGTDGAELRGYVVSQNTGNTAGGYIDLTPITYHPYGMGPACMDQYGNEVNQPNALPGISSFAKATATSTFSSGLSSITVSSAAGLATGDQIVGLGIPAGEYITGISGTTLSLALATTATETATTLTFFNNQLWMWNSGSPLMPFNQSCGVPLPRNILNGINTNGYLFALGGLATDFPAFNAIQSMKGGVMGRALFTSDTYNGTGATCGTPGTCGGSYYNTDGSNGVPTLIAGDTYHGGAFYWDTSLSAMRLYNGSSWHSILTDTLSYVSSVTASGAGISASPTTGGVVVSNTGVTSLAASAPLSASGSTGSITISCSACSGAPASPSTSVQFNNGGAFGGSSNFTWDNGNSQLTIAQGASGSVRGYIGDVFNSTAANTSTAHAIQTQGGTFVIYGDGHAAFSHSVTTQTLTASYDATLATGGAVFIDGPNANFKTLAFTMNGSNRFDLSLNADTETGSNAGSNFVMTRLNDSGGFLDRPLTISRQTGIVTFADGIALGSSANFYNRTFAGAAPSCSGVADGWMGYETTTDQLWICNGGTAHAH